MKETKTSYDMIKEYVQNCNETLSDYFDNYDGFADCDNEPDENGYTGNFRKDFCDLNVNWVVYTDGYYRGCKITLTVGGPFCEIDTDAGIIYGRWGTGFYCEPLLTTRNINSVMSDYYECTRV